MIEIIFRSMVAGASILVAALFLNFIATKFGISTWYDFVKEPSKTNFISYVWLFLIYPFCLGLSAYAALNIFK